MEGGHKTIAGRTTNESYLANILRTKHGSVLEHAVWTLLLEGVSRALTHELVRHRAGIGILAAEPAVRRRVGDRLRAPAGDRGGDARLRGLGARLPGSLETYRELLGDLTEQIGEHGPATMRKKRARQAARAVLPNAAETKIVVTGNARSWRHFVEMRGSPGADVEIRRLAVACCACCRPRPPTSSATCASSRQPDGTEIVETENSKV
jgi:thymidylate synthase (FAD)